MRELEQQLREAPEPPTPRSVERGWDGLHSTEAVGDRWMNR